MKIKFPSGIALVILAATTFSGAYASNTPIPCPSVDFIKQHMQYVNAVQIVRTRDFAVYTSIPFYDNASHLKWHIGSEVHTADFNSAYYEGKGNIQDASYQVYKLAEYLQDFWLCLYSDDHKTAVYLISPIKEPGDLISKMASRLRLGG